jgi:Tol biopolymer transport system component
MPSKTLRLSMIALVCGAIWAAAGLRFAVRADPAGPVPGGAASTAGSVEADCMPCHQAAGSVSHVQQITHVGRNMRPAWSPDGRKVAFYSTRSGNDDVWTFDLETGEEVQVTTDQASDRRPTWSPDGNWLAFDSDRSGNRDIWVVRADGSDLTPLTTNPREELFASWSPDGATIAFFSYGSGTNELWAIGADGRDPRPVVPELASEDAQQCSFACHEPSWSQDSARLAFHSQRSGDRDIWLVNIDGTDLTHLPTGPGEDLFPAWTPDGQIVFVTERISIEKAWNDVRVISADGTEETTLFTEVAHGGPFYWSPDGNRIALHSQRSRANFNIYVATIGQPPGAEVTGGAVEAKSEASPTEAAGRQAQAAVQVPRWGLVVAALAALLFIAVLIGAGVFILARVTK